MSGLVGWHLVVPLKPAASGKSRLGADEGVVRAIGISTVRAAVAAAGVAEVVVVTADSTTASALNGIPRLRIVREHAPRGLRLAISSALMTIPTGAHRAVLLGDLPALRPVDLESALHDARHHARAFVADARGTGTTLVTARPGLAWRSAFGRASASRHRLLGLTELRVSLRSSLRHDVDTPRQLARAIAASTI